MKQSESFKDLFSTAAASLPNPTNSVSQGSDAATPVGRGHLTVVFVYISLRSPEAEPLFTR